MIKGLSLYTYEENNPAQTDAKYYTAYLRLGVVRVRGARVQGALGIGLGVYDLQYPLYGDVCPTVSL